jgi:hypothetical protein
MRGEMKYMPTGEKTVQIVMPSPNQWHAKQSVARYVGRKTPDAAKK